MNIMPQREARDDEEDLSKLLAGVGAATTPGKSATEATGLQFEEVGPPPAPAALPAQPAVAAPALPIAAPSAPPAPAAPPAVPTIHLNEDLETIKKSALEELRPLVDKLNLSPEDKFDTLLLIIRSTDDQTLLATAHEAAQAITDESKRAQALLDIIKEIDYFATQPAQPQQ